MVPGALKREDVERWLAAERDGLDGGAERAFARVFAALPKAEPGAGFVDRVVQASWRARQRRRRVLRVARTIASAAAAVAGVALCYLAVVQGGAWLVRTGAMLTVQAVSLVVRSAAEGLDWWSIVARVGAATGESLATPQMSTAVVAVELVGVAALYALHRLLRTDKDNNTDSWEART